MPKTKTNDPGAHHASSGALIRRFLPYLANYKMVLCLDLFCAALTTLCDIVLPKIMSTITNSAMGVGITLTAGIVLKLAALYFVLRIIDGAAIQLPDHTLLLSLLEWHSRQSVQGLCCPIRYIQELDRKSVV